MFESDAARATKTDTPDDRAAAASAAVAVATVNTDLGMLYHLRGNLDGARERYGHVVQMCVFLPRPLFR